MQKNFHSTGPYTLMFGPSTTHVYTCTACRKEVSHSPEIDDRPFSPANHDHGCGPAHAPAPFTHTRTHTTTKTQDTK